MRSYFTSWTVGSLRAIFSDYSDDSGKGDTMHLKVVNVESGAILVDQDCANLSVASDVFLSLQEEEGDNEEE